MCAVRLNEEKKNPIEDNVNNEFIRVLSCTCMSMSIYINIFRLNT